MTPKSRMAALAIIATTVTSFLCSMLTTSKMSELLFADQKNDYLHHQSRSNNATLEQHNKNTPSANNNRTLVIVMGELRAGEAAWQTLYKNVLDPNSADLALMTTNNLTLYPNNTLMKRAKFIWYYEQYDDWADAVDLVAGRGWRTTHLPEFHDYNTYAHPGRNRSILFGGISGHSGSGIIIFMMRYFLMQKIKASGILGMYERFVVTRTDHYYLCPHLFTTCDIRGNTIWVPAGETYGGYTDRHLIVGKENLLDALDIITPLVTKPYDFDYEKHHNTERFVKSVWTEEKNLTVKKCHRSMFTVATKHDTTRWKPGEDELPNVPGLLIKYPREYLKAKIGCEQFHFNRNHTLVRGVTKYILQNETQSQNNLEKMKGPLLFRWNGTTIEEGMSFCQNKAGLRSFCPYKAYCVGHHIFSGIQRSNNEELWSPVFDDSQPLWVSVGSVDPCMQRGSLGELNKTKVKFILCCHEGEEEQAETMPDFVEKPELCEAPIYA